MIAGARATFARTIVALASAVILTSVAAPAFASTDRTCSAARAWISVAIASDAPLTSAERRGLVDDLAVELADRGVDVCDDESASAAPRPIAKLSIAIAPADAALVRLAIDDAVTGKSTTRDVSLRDVPRIAWGPSLSLAARELLRASWVELALTPPATPPPPIVPTPIAPEPALARAIARDVAPESSRTRAASSFAVTAEVARWGADVTLIGGRARASFAIARPIAVTLGGGAASSFTVDASDGRVVASSIFADAGLDLLLTSATSPAPLTAIARVDFDRLALHASATTDATAHDATTVLVAPLVGLRAAFALGAHLGLTIEADGGPIVRGARGLDAGALAIDLRGAVVALSIGVEVAR